MDCEKIFNDKLYELTREIYGVMYTSLNILSNEGEYGLPKYARAIERAMFEVHIKIWDLKMAQKGSKITERPFPYDEDKIRKCFTRFINRARCIVNTAIKDPNISANKALSNLKVSLSKCNLDKLKSYAVIPGVMRKKLNDLNDVINTKPEIKSLDDEMNYPCCMISHLWSIARSALTIIKVEWNESKSFEKAIMIEEYQLLVKKLLKLFNKIMIPISQ